MDPGGKRTWINRHGAVGAPGWAGCSQAERFEAVRDGSAGSHTTLSSVTHLHRPSSNSGASFNFYGGILGGVNGTRPSNTVTKTGSILGSIHSK